MIHHIYSEATSLAGWSLKGSLSVFAPAFFLVSWATGQIFRVKKQANLEQDLFGYRKSAAKFGDKARSAHQGFYRPRYWRGKHRLFHTYDHRARVYGLRLSEQSKYPVFDIQAEVIDLDEPIQPETGKFWTRHRFLLQSLYPHKIVMGAYRFDIRGRERLYLNVFIQTRTQGLTQLIRIAKTSSGVLIAIKN